MSDLDTNCLTMEMFNPKIADECFDNLILNFINTIRKNQKHSDVSFIYKFLCKS